MLERVGKPCAPLAEVSARSPVREHRGGQPKLDLAFARVACPGERGADVLVLLVVTEVLAVQLSAAPALEPLLCPGQEVVGVRAGDELRFSRLVEPLGRILADRLEYAESRLAVGPLLLTQQVVLQQGLELVEASVADGLGGFQAAAA